MAAGGAGFRAAAAASVLSSTLARPPPGRCLMFSVEPTLARTFFRSGVDALVAGRLSLGAKELGLADVGFLSTARVPEARGDTGVGLTRLGAAPAGEPAPGPAAVFLAVLLEVLFARLKSAGADFVTVFLASAGFPSVLVPAGLLGRGVGALLLLSPVDAAEAAAGAFGAAWVLLELGLEAGWGGVAFFSGTFASATGLGLASLAGEAAGLAVVAAGRLGGAAGPEPEAGLMGFLGGPPQVVGAGCLGREVDCVLAFDVEVFAG